MRRRPTVGFDPVFMKTSIPSTAKILWCSRILYGRIWGMGVPEGYLIVIMDTANV